MSKVLIQQKPDFQKKVDNVEKLKISEMFSDTLQGEGIYSGVPATFMRLQGCTLVCVWCDTLDVWSEGNEYSFEEIFEMWEEIGLIERFKIGQHLVMTGGSPLKQQEQVLQFIKRFIQKYSFKPFIEIENEGVLMPIEELIQYIDCWNNSVKLANSGMKEKARYKPTVIEKLATLPNSWFKFVVDTEEDWQEIVEFFIDPNLIRKDQIIVMPQGQTQEELLETRGLTADLAIKHNLRFCSRLHIDLWNKKTGV